MIPGARTLAALRQNQSERYEGRFVSIKLEKSPSLFFKGMEGSVIPIAVAHGEGFAEFATRTPRRSQFLRPGRRPLRR